MSKAIEIARKHLAFVQRKHGSTIEAIEAHGNEHAVVHVVLNQVRSSRR